MSTDETFAQIRRLEVAARDGRFDAQQRRGFAQSARWLAKRMGAPAANLVVAA